MSTSAFLQELATLYMSMFDADPDMGKQREKSCAKSSHHGKSVEQWKKLEVLHNMMDGWGKNTHDLPWRTSMFQDAFLEEFEFRDMWSPKLWPRERTESKSMAGWQDGGTPWNTMIFSLTSWFHLINYLTDFNIFLKYNLSKIFPFFNIDLWSLSAPKDTSRAVRPQPTSFRCIGPRWISSEWDEFPRRTWPSGWRTVHPRWEFCILRWWSFWWIGHGFWWSIYESFCGQVDSLMFEDVMLIHRFCIWCCWCCCVVGQPALDSWFFSIAMILILGCRWCHPKLAHFTQFCLSSPLVANALQEQPGRSFQAFRSLAPPVEGDRPGFGKLRAVNEQFANWMIYHLSLSKRIIIPCIPF